MIKKMLIATMVAASLSGVATTASAAVDLYVNVAPPENRVEVVPAPRAGYVWAPGYWDYRGHRHAWVRGHWERERRGYIYNEPRWEQRDNRWVMHRGGWARGDRDHDGVPNGMDRHPDNPHRN